MAKVLDAFLNVFRFHKKKILFFLGSTIFCFVILFPYDDLSDFITLQISKATQNNVYLQFDGLSFALLPQLGVQMEDVMVESIFAPTLAVKTLGIAPNFVSMLTGKPGATVKAWGLFDGDAVVSVGPSNELETKADEMSVSVDLEEVSMKELSKFLKDSYRFPLSMSGVTQLDSKLYIDPTFKAQPKGDIELNIQKLKIPSSNIPINMSGVTMSMPFPALEMSEVVVVGKINDRKLFIKEGKIGDPKNDLFGSVTGDFYFDILPGGRMKPGGYDLKLNLNIKDALNTQLASILDIVDIYSGIGEKHKFKSLNGVRYSMRLTAKDMRTPPRVSGN